MWLLTVDSNLDYRLHLQRLAPSYAFGFIFLLSILRLTYFCHYLFKILGTLSNVSNSRVSINQSTND